MLCACFLVQLSLTDVLLFGVEFALLNQVDREILRDMSPDCKPALFGGRALHTAENATRSDTKGAGVAQPNYNTSPVCQSGDLVGPFRAPKTGKIPSASIPLLSQLLHSGCSTEEIKAHLRMGTLPWWLLCASRSNTKM